MELEEPPRQQLMVVDNTAEVSSSSRNATQGEEFTSKNFSFLESLRSIRGQEGYDSDPSLEFVEPFDRNKRYSNYCPYSNSTQLDSKAELGSGCSEIVYSFNSTPLPILSSREFSNALEQACQEDFLNYIPEITESPSKKRLLVNNFNNNKTHFKTSESSTENDSVVGHSCHSQARRKIVNGLEKYPEKGVPYGYPNIERDSGIRSQNASKLYQNGLKHFYNWGEGTSPDSFSKVYNRSSMKYDYSSLNSRKAVKQGSGLSNEGLKTITNQYPYRHEVELTVKPDKSWPTKDSDVVSTVKVRVDIMQTCNTSGIAGALVPTTGAQCSIETSSTHQITRNDDQVFKKDNLTTCKKQFEESAATTCKVEAEFPGPQYQDQAENKQVKKYDNPSTPKSQVSYVDLKPVSKQMENVFKGLQCSTLSDGASIPLSHLSTVDQTFSNRDQTDFGSKLVNKNGFASEIASEFESVPETSVIKQEMTVKAKTASSRSHTREKHAKDSTRKAATTSKLIPILPRQHPENVFFNGQLMAFQNSFAGNNGNKPLTNQRDVVHKRKGVPNRTISADEGSLVNSKKPCPLQSIPTTYPVQYSMNANNQSQPYTIQHQPDMLPLHILQQGNGVQRVLSPQMPTSPIQNLSDLVSKLIPDVNSIPGQQDAEQVMGFVSKLQYLLFSWCGR